MAEKISIILSDGSVDKLMVAATLASGAAVMEKEVLLFLTMGGLLAFRRGDWKTNSAISPDLSPVADAMRQGLKGDDKGALWLSTLRSAKEVGNLDIVACSQTMDMFGIKKDDLEPVVDSVGGVATYYSKAEEGQTIFI